MPKRKGAWILCLPFAALTISGGIVTHQYARRNALRQELKQTRSEFRRLIALLPAKYKVKVVKAEKEAHDHEAGENHKH